MSTNKWDRFISDEELNNSTQYHNSPNGRYLFGKILHDVLECLNSYTAVLYLIKQPGVDIPVETGNWLVAKSCSVEATIADLNALWVHHNEEMSPTSNEWPVLIRRIETSAKEVESLTKGCKGLVMPDHEHSVDLIKTAIINLKRLMLILADIRAEEYTRLWTTKKYEVL